MYNEGHLLPHPATRLLEKKWYSVDLRTMILEDIIMILQIQDGAPTLLGNPFALTALTKNVIRSRHALFISLYFFIQTISATNGIPWPG